MYELTLTSRKQLERASLRAQAQKPRIEEIAFGMYKVWSTNPATPYKTYSTGIEPAQGSQGGYEVCCSCPTQNFFCKHVAAIFPHYLMREKQEAGWEATKEAAENAAMIAEVEAMLAKDRQDIFG